MCSSKDTEDGWITDWFARPCHAHYLTGVGLAKFKSELAMLLQKGDLNYDYY